MQEHKKYLLLIHFLSFLKTHSILSLKNCSENKCILIICVGEGMHATVLVWKSEDNRLLEVGCLLLLCWSWLWNSRRHQSWQQSHRTEFCTLYLSLPSSLLMSHRQRFSKHNRNAFRSALVSPLTFVIPDRELLCYDCPRCVSPKCVVSEEGRGSLWCGGGGYVLISRTQEIQLSPGRL